MNTPVNFTIAKLLKEKECDIRVRHYYGSSVNPHIPYAKTDYEIPINYNNPTNSGTIKQLISAPTIAEVVMWLYEKHGIWIIVSTTISKQFINKCVDMNGGKHPSKSNYPTCVSKSIGAYHNSPKEAYEDAIEHVLTLI